MNNNVSKLVNIADGKTAKNEYVYGKDNLPEKYTIDGGRNVTYTYDTLNRMTNTSIATTKPIDMEYKYWRSQRNTGDLVKYKTTKISEESVGGEKFIYYYDDQGNITSIKKMTYNADGTEAGYTTPVAEYEYDELGELVFEKIGTGTEQKKYSYDAGGNLLKETYEVVSGGRVISSTVTNYGYEDTNWKDKLTSYGGKAITYDEIGNPLSYRGMTMTWQNGRQLATLKKGTTAVSYTYDANSTRATKIVNGVKYTYQYLDGKLIHETRGEKSLHYYYDANGYLTAIKYRLTPDGQDFAYYATHNWRGDVIGLYNGDGNLVAKYEYDTWGMVRSIKDANGTRITDQNHVGNLNPFRYRGYYYDTESQLYYLMTRYYDPVTHRFLNADGYFQSGNTILDSNMNAYCRNNPINSFDANGDVVFVYGYEGSAIFGAGITGSITWVSDLHGNIGIQGTYTGFDADSPTVGLPAASVGSVIGVVWDADTIYDLEKSCWVASASGGSLPYIGGTLLHFNDSPDDEYDGFSLGWGVGFAFPLDANQGRPTTKTLWSTNIWGDDSYKPSTSAKPQSPKKNSGKSKPAKKRYCSGCGRPIGTGPGKCSGGW